MRAHLSNAAYGVLDYAAYPIAMVLSAPTLLKHLGVEQYGIWIVITAALNTGSIIASGFGDANIQYIASARNQGDSGSVVASGAEHARHQSPAGRSVCTHFLDAGAARSRPPGRLRGGSASSLPSGAQDRQCAHAGAGHRNRLCQHAEGFRAIWGSHPYQPLYPGDHRGSGRGAEHPRIWRRRHHGGDSLLPGSWNLGSAYSPAAIPGSGLALSVVRPSRHHSSVPIRSV